MKTNHGAADADHNQPEHLDLTTRIIMFLSARPDDLGHFFAISGFAPDELRRNLHDEGFQAGLLDYITANESLLLAFCDEHGEKPARLVRLATQEDVLN